MTTKAGVQKIQTGESNPDENNSLEGNYVITDIVDIEQLRGLFEDFSRATGFTTGFVSFPEQKILIATGWRDICTKFHRDGPVSSQFCKESNIYLTGCLNSLEKLSIKPCGNGLVDAATPVVIRGKHLASLATGQVLLAPPDLEFFKNQAITYGYDVDEYLAALAQVPVVTKEQLKRAMSFLSGLAVVIAEEGLRNLRHRESEKALQKEIAERSLAEKALVRSEEKFRFLFTASRDAIMLLDRNEFLDCNEATLKIFGCSGKEQFVSKSPTDFSPTKQPDGRNSLTASRAYIEAAFTLGSVFFEWLHQREDGTLFTAEVSLSRFELNGEMVLQAVLRDITTRKEMEREILEISEFEKRRLGQDLHNDLCRRMTAISLVSNLLSEELTGLGIQQADDARQIADLIRKAAGQARSLARGLSPMALVDGRLTKELELLTINTGHLFKVPCFFECSAPIILQEERLASHLYRIAQEALTNAAKHSKATRILLSVSCKEGVLELAVTDDGVGFGDTSPNLRGIGVNIMRYRAHQIGASLEIQSGEETGTTVSCSLPMPEESPTLPTSTSSTAPVQVDFLTLRDHGLTRRECEVLHWIAQGKRDGEIAVILSISLRTINHHVSSILGKLGVETRTAAATRAIELLL